MDLAKLGKDLQAGKITTQPWLLPGGAKLAWKTDAPLDSTTGTGYKPHDFITDVEMVAMPHAGDDPQAYLLQTDIVSDKDQAVELVAASDRALAAYLNNEDIKGRREIRLRQGVNRLWVVHPAWDVAFMRLTTPGTAQRVTNVRFTPPPSNASGAAPYRPVP